MILFPDREKPYYLTGVDFKLNKKLHSKFVINEYKERQMISILKEQQVLKSPPKKDYMHKNSIKGTKLREEINNLKKDFFYEKRRRKKIHGKTATPNVFFMTTKRCGPLRGPSSSSCGGLQPLAEAFFCPPGKKRSFYICFGQHFGHFWRSVVTSVTFSSNLSNFKKIQKNPKNSKISNNSKKSEKSKKSKKLKNIKKCKKI